MDAQVMISAFGVLGTLGGTGGQRIEKLKIKNENLEKKIQKCKQEILAYQAEESIAVEWLVELRELNTPQSGQIDLRDRTEQKHGLRPTMTPSQAENL
jgi:hypothetical protein